MRTLEQRFISYFSKSQGCWIWQGAKDNHGYGVINDGTGKGRIVRAHRLSWILHNGPLKKGQHVLHKCDTPACVNPDHLFLGDQRSNMLDRDRKGRVAKGENAGPSKLTEEQVRQIKAEYVPGKRGGRLGLQVGSQRWLSKKYGIAQGCIGRILNGKNWKHIH